MTATDSRKQASKMRIRPATTDDFRAIVRIWNNEIRESLATFNCVEKSLADLEALHSNAQKCGHAFLVGLKSGEVIGFSFYGQFRGGAGYAHTMEHTVYVAPDAAGLGKGRALLEAIEDHARAGGAHSMIAGVCGENHPGLAFHLRLGYAETARLPKVGRKFGQWLDLVLLQKFL